MFKFLLKMGSFFMNLMKHPIPKSISFFWSMGSFLVMLLFFQAFTGILLSFFYSNLTMEAFSSVEALMRVTPMYKYRWLHMNMASLFFIIIYLHISRGLFYFSFKKKEVWNIGVVILMLLMATSFLGYSLPWGQMSYWAVTVITKFFSVLPVIGTSLVFWIWGGMMVQVTTLKFFFSLHFIFPFLILALVIMHVLSLHKKKGMLKSGFLMTNFSPIFFWKDLLNLMVIILLIFLLNVWSSSEDNNFLEANIIMTPPHIKPEWYFLFAYAILRSVPNKLFGVILLLMSLLIMFFLSFFKLFINHNTQWLSKLLFSSFLTNFVFLTWIGSNPVTNLFAMMGKASALMYFLSMMGYLVLKALSKK